MAEFRLETPRLRMREWRAGDRDPFWAMCRDEELMRYLPKVDRAGIDAMVDRQIAMQAEHGFCFWVLEGRDDGIFHGVVGLGAPRPPLAEVEVGWRLARHAWKQGFAQEAARAALDHAFNDRALPAVIAITVPANRASRTVMERLGMVPCPDETFDHPDLPEGDPLRRHVLYRIQRPA